MIIKADRSEFDVALSDPLNNFLLLFKDTPLSNQIHDKADGIAEDWQKVFLITDINILTLLEKQNWYVGDDHYTTLSKEKNLKRSVVEQELLAKLCVAGKPSSRLIQVAFAKADIG